MPRAACEVVTTYESSKNIIACHKKLDIVYVIHEEEEEEMC